MKLVLLFSTVLLVGCSVPFNQIAPTNVVASNAVSTVSKPIARPAPARPMPIPNLAGPWEFQFVPTPQTGDEAGTPQVNLVELNLQQSGNNITADSSSNQLMFLFQYDGPEYQLFLTCTGVQAGSVAGTISDDGLSFTLLLTEFPSPGQTQESIQIVGAVNSDGSFKGTYSGPNNQGLNGCPLNAAGTFSGSPVKTPFSGTYVGELVNGEIASMETVSLTLAQSNVTLSVTGVDDGVPFAVSGFTMGSFFQAPTFVSGTGRSQSFSGYMPLNSNAQLWVWDDVSGDTGILQLQN